VYARALNAQKLNRPREAVQSLRTLDPGRGWAKSYPFILPLMAECDHMLGDHGRELDAARRGRRLFPDLQVMRSAEVSALAVRGRIRELDRCIEESLLLPPQSLWPPARVMHVAGEELRAHGHPGEARRMFEREIEWCRARPSAEAGTRAGRAWLAQALYWAGSWDEARPLYERLAAENPAQPEYLGRLGGLAARRGDRAAALRYDAALDTLRAPYLNGANVYWRACIASLLGDRARAVSLLREAFRQGNRFGIVLHYELDFDALRDDPGFREFLRPKG
jgi:tetratricopeptide (TPR) repeat protein